jgi:hypothetical protein
LLGLPGFGWHCDGGHVHGRRPLQVTDLLVQGVELASLVGRVRRRREPGGRDLGPRRFIRRAGLVVLRRENRRVDARISRRELPGIRDPGGRARAVDQGGG